ncbi:hypothetical protein [Agrobacterium tumefaciens]|uniref:hypothetical protein n=1 Tax=Agrobacterium tumefaciens TaxID=358 RepID=UPI0021D33E53|nr:hypothetical protein [Agrobacterium tumefaciens]UXS01128.1 hypothetical protein FY156_06295 [Agrobacterium tumefaciens]
MTNEDLRKRWAEANERVELLDKQRYQLLAHTEQEWLEAQTAFQKVVDECVNGDAFLCTACDTPIFPGDQFHAGATPLCYECAPTFQSMLNEPELFVDLINEKPSSPEDLRAAFDAHIAAGGSPDDKMVEVYE